MRALIVAAALAVAVPALPALAGTTTVPTLAPCANPEGLKTVTLNTAGVGTLDTPSLIGNAEEGVQLLVDFAGRKEGYTGNVDAVISWGVPTNDYDLRLDSDESSGTGENFQPVDAAEETASVGGVTHCSVVTVTAIDFLAPAAVDTISYNVTIS